MKVKEDTTNVAIHFFLINQFLDFSVSPGLDRVNYGVLLLVSVLAGLSSGPLIPS